MELKLTEIEDENNKQINLIRWKVQGIQSENAYFDSVKLSERLA